MFRNMFALRMINFVTPVRGFACRGMAGARTAPFAVTRASTFGNSRMAFRLNRLTTRLRKRLGVSTAANAVATGGNGAVPMNARAMTMGTGGMGKRRAAAFALTVRGGGGFFAAVACNGGLKLPRNDTFRCEFGSTRRLTGAIVPTPGASVPRNIAMA